VSDGSDLLAALTPVAEALDRLGVAYQIGGSVASSVHGMARATMDIDLVADLGPDDVDAFVEALGDEYYADAAMIREAIERRSSFNLIHQPTMFKVDVFVPRERDFDRSSLGRRVRESLSPDPEARAFYVATAEDTLLAKLEWFDRGGRTSERQWSDIIGVLRVQGEALEVDYLKRWAEDLGLTELLDRAFEES
jgi:hypothetical protein